jgi:signal transduction histidine kinase/ligand-binding sensor domain-containing protein
VSTLARLWVVAWLVLGAPVAAADRIGHLAFRGYGSDDGVALDLTVGLQDHEGFIWAASPSGLFRYDGIRFQRFGATEGLPSTFVTDMAIGPDGRLWGATSRGVFYKHGDRFVAVGVDVLPVDGMHLLAFDVDRRTWITTTRGPYALVAPGRFELVPGWPGGEAFGILAESDGSMLVGRGARLVRCHHDGTIEDLGHDFVERITSIVRDGVGRVWLRAGAHLWMQPRAGAPFEDWSHAYLGTSSPDSNARLALGATKTLLIPTALGLIEIAGDEAHFVKTDLAEDAASIRAVWVDREGSMWLASLGLQHELGRGMWRTISRKDGLPSNNVWSITGLHDGSVAVGTDRGVAIIDHGSIQRITDQPVVATVEQPAGVLWIVGSHQIVLYDTATHATRRIDPKSGLSDGFTSAAVIDGVVWIGTESGVYKGDGARFELVRPPGSPPSTVWGLARDGDRLWMTTGYGLFVLDRGTWFHFTTRDGLRDDGLTFVTPNRQEICASYLSSFGLTCFHYADGQITRLRHLDASTGLNIPVPYSLTADHEGRLWVGGAHGVSIFFEDGSIDHFTRAGGAPGDDCNSNASWVEPNGDVWIGTSSGLGVFESARYTRAVAPPVVTFERGELGGVGVDFGSPGLVSYDHAQLDVEFAAVSFLDERQIQYQVRLVGFDDTWRDSRGDAHYHKLASGSYQFAVRARYRDARWGEPTIFELVVAAPYWQTWWFRALGIGLVGLALVVIVRWRSRALVRRNAELETIVQLRTRELVTANARVAHIDKLAALGRLLAQLSHEINNPLNVIHNNVGPLEEYSQALHAALEECKQLATGTDQRVALAALWERLELDYIVEDSSQAFAITKHAIKRIADIHNELKLFLRDEPLEHELIEISKSTRETATMLARSLPLVELRCELEPLPLVLVHVGRINQAVTNLLQNAADAMDGNGRITIRGSADDARVQIRISDSGPGIPAALQSKIFEPFFTTKEVGHGMGLGLSICREIMVAHHGSLEIDDSYVGGACFVITLPRAAR